jgi:hypothetical protein
MVSSREHGMIHGIPQSSELTGAGLHGRPCVREYPPMASHRGIALTFWIRYKT